VLAYLIQCVGITPIVKDPDLRADLCCLQQHPVSERFGCFFLHNLNLSTAELPEINEKDPPNLLCRMGIEAGQAKQEDAQALKPPTRPTADGVTWAQLKTLIIQGDKRAAILPFEFDPLWVAYSVAQTIFCTFTNEFWALVPDAKFEKLPRLVTLEAAMKMWTVQSVQSRINHGVRYELSPSADGLSGAIPPKTRTQIFRDKRVSFFPEPGSSLNPKSGWCNFFAIGYVKDYHDELVKSIDGGKALRDALDNIFEQLQVLPRKPSLPSSHKTLWCWERGCMNLLLNSRYIRLLDRHILHTGGLVTEKRNRGPRNIRPVAQMTDILLGQREHTHLNQTKAMRKAMRKPQNGEQEAVPAQEQQMVKGRRRGKAKGYREPPRRLLCSPSPEPVAEDSEYVNQPAQTTHLQQESEESDAGDADDEKEDCAAGG